MKLFDRMAVLTALSRRNIPEERQVQLSQRVLTMMDEDLLTLNFEEMFYLFAAGAVAAMIPYVEDLQAREGAAILDQLKREDGE